MKNFLVKADLHLHSKASNKPAGWFTHLIGCPESFSEPLEIYHTLKRRGMNYITITDHDTIEGVLEIAHFPEVFLGCEYTVFFPEEKAKVHVLAYGFTEIQHQELLKLRENIYDFVKYLKIHKIPHSLAHPFYAVEDTIIHKRLVEKFVLLFDNWEIINGTRGNEVSYIEENIARIYDCWEMIYLLAENYEIEPLRTREVITFTGGSDDHGGLDVGRTWTAVEGVSSVEEFLKGILEGRTLVHSEPLGEERLLNTISKIGLEFIKRKSYFFWNKKEEEKDFKTADLSLRNLIFSDENHLFLTNKEFLKYLPTFTLRRALEELSLEAFEEAGFSLFLHFLPLILKYAQMKEQRKIKALAQIWGIRKYKPVKVAYLTDTYDHINGVALSTKLMQKIAFEERLPIKFVICSKDRVKDFKPQENLVNFTPIFEFSVPFYDELKMGVPNLIELIEFLEKEEFTGIHLATPGPLGLAGFLAGKILGFPLTFTIHTDLPSYIKIYTLDGELETFTWKILIYLATAVNHCFVPSEFYRKLLIEKGGLPNKISTFPRGIDRNKFSPKYRKDDFWSNKLGIKENSEVILYVGRISKEKNLDLLFQIASYFPDRTFVLVGDGPYRKTLEERKVPHIYFTGYLQGEELSQAYASSDIFLFPSETETYGLVVLEAMASGLPVIVSSQGASHEHVRDGVNGFIAHTLEDYVEKLSLLLNYRELRLKMGKEALKTTMNLDFRKTYLEYMKQIITIGAPYHENSRPHNLLSPPKWRYKTISHREGEVP
ncbi:MAG: glycosyltransferase [Thermodesulfobacteriaceae bacterium]|nr:glycosyltransferase [Thermodesulfobacteriaceae bacterium]